MKWFHNLKLGNKLFISFTVISLILITEGVVGLEGISTMVEQAHEVHHKNLVEATQVNKLSKLVYQHRLLLFQMVGESDPDQMDVLIQTLDEKHQEITQIVENKALNPSRKELDLFFDEWKQVIANSQKIINMSKNFAKEDAFEMANRENKELFDQSMQRIEQIVISLEERIEAGHEKSEAVQNSILLTMSTVVGIGLILAILLAVLISRSITVPLYNLIHLSQSIADGDLSGDLSGENVNVIVRNEIAQLTNVMNQMKNKLKQMIHKIKDSSSMIASASSQIASGNENLASQVNQQAASLEETSSSMEEMNAIIQNNAQNAKEANAISLRTKGIVENGRAQLMETLEQTISTNQKALDELKDTNHEVVGAMADITTRSEKISGITTLMNDIAFQTNLLALNAAVEAARAGEQGKGFAVVAAEVRNLAWRSSKASKQINKLIVDSLERINKGREMVDNSDKTIRDMSESIGTTLREMKEESSRNLDEILKAVSQVADVVENISVASAEQAEGVHQVNNAVSEMDNITQKNSALVEEIAISSKSLAVEGHNLNKLVGAFKIENQSQGTVATPDYSNLIEGPSPARIKARSESKVFSDDDLPHFE